MDDYHSSLKNLFVYTQNMGTLLIQPHSPPPTDAKAVHLVIFPRRFKSREEMNSVVEWAFTSRAQGYCLSEDVPRVENEIRGAHRYLHRIEGYRELRFQSGSIEFFPARRAKRENSFKSFVCDFGEICGLIKNRSYHVAIKPTNETAVVFLSTPELDPVEWSLIERCKPGFIVGSADFSKKDWQELSEKVNFDILWAPEVDYIQTAAVAGLLNEVGKGSQTWKTPQKENSELTEKVSSF